MSKENEIIAQVRKVVFEINELPPDKRRSLIFDYLEEELKKLKFGDDQVDGLIFKTRDLTQFKDVKGNRIINENSAKIAKLASSIARVGNIVPNVVNENMGVIDGQRRLVAVRRHGLSSPVRYTFERGADLQIISELNQDLLPWGYREWLHRYVAIKEPAYVEYQSLAAKYEQYMKSRSLRGLLMYGRVDPLRADVWERGEFTIDKQNLPNVIAFMELLKSVYLIGDKDNIFAKDRNFQKALWDIFTKTKNLDLDRLLVKLRTAFNRINIKTDYKTYRKVLSEIYNMRLSGDKHHIVADDDGQLKVV